MADKPLKSITFPGLADKYMIPEIDSTLTQQGEAADAKKTGDEVSDIRNTLSTKADQDDLASLNLTGTTNTSGSTITLGTFFYLNGTLVRAQTDIASGATFTLNTNYTIVTDGALNQPDIVEIIPLSIIATDVISSLGQSRCYKIGRIVLLQVACQFAATPVGNRVLIGGAPRPIASVTQISLNSSKDLFFGSVVNDNGNGVFQKANDLATAAGWYNFNFTYLSYE